MDTGPENYTDTSGLVPSVHSEMATHSRQPFQIAATCVFLSLAVPAVILRLWIRKYMINSIGLDDHMMVVALFAFVIYNASLMAIVANGGGTHLDSNATTLKAAINWVVVNEVFYLMTQIFLKISLGFFFLRVVVKKVYRRLIYATMCFSTIINTYHIFFVIFRCGDPRFFADHEIAGHCVKAKVQVALGYEQAAVSTITDLIFAAMPIPLLWNANMDLRSKISAGLILSLGAFGSIASIIRFLYVGTLGFGEDFFWAAVNISIWSTVELGTGIIAASLATYRPLLKRVVRSTRHHLTSHTKYDKNRKSTWKSSLTKPPPIYDNVESLPSVFRPWESVGESGGFTTTCVGGSQLDKDEKRSFSASRSKKNSRNGSKNDSRNKSIDILTSADYTDRSAIWPFVEDSAGIAKVVDVRVSVSDALDTDIEMQQPMRTYRRSEEGGGLWGMRYEDKIRSPHRTEIDHNGSRASTPEWERLPDLIPLVPHRKSTDTSSGKSKGPDSPFQPSKSFQ